MSYLSTQTKKVSVYGRKASSRVINRQSTFTALANDENDPFGFFQPRASSPLKPKSKPSTSSSPSSSSSSSSVAAVPSRSTRKKNNTITRKSRNVLRVESVSDSDSDSDSASESESQRRGDDSNDADDFGKLIYVDPTPTPVQLQLVEALGDLSIATRSPSPSPERHTRRSARHANKENDDDNDDDNNNAAAIQELLDTVAMQAPQPLDQLITRLRTPLSTTSTAARKRLRKLAKIGEASYSEVFKTSPLSTRSRDVEAQVLKIIPIAAEAGAARQRDGDSGDAAATADLPDCSSAQDVCREIRIMQMLGSDHGASPSSAPSASFVKLHSAYVAVGTYPDQLLQAWDEWDASRRTKLGTGAENIRPSSFPASQLYAVLVMSDGGPDLETFKVRSWTQAAAVFWQVAAALGQAEQRHEFEHRDLHWGNVLVRSHTPLIAESAAAAAAARHGDERGKEDEHEVDTLLSTSSSSTRQHSTRRSASSCAAAPASRAATRQEPALDLEFLLDPKRCGLQATVIDYSLSRAAVPRTLTRCSLSSTALLERTDRDADREDKENLCLRPVSFYAFSDPSLFQGKGDLQFDVYRRMNLATRAQWAEFHPSTNILWLHYLAEKLVTVKCRALKAPKPPSLASQRNAPPLAVEWAAHRSMFYLLELLRGTVARLDSEASMKTTKRHPSSTSSSSSSVALEKGLPRRQPLGESTALSASTNNTNTSGSGSGRAKTTTRARKTRVSSLTSPYASRKPFPALTNGRDTADQESHQGTLVRSAAELVARARMPVFPPAAASSF
ncbi:hypothetical protein BCV70DRAFT_202857 [Testicularia cyperi]|uniref:non-specific serine/threonine protein kinase n=1 Tax=Testicularia cyperi TaxID=1882483 RepID=A0A317XGK2_9BASI|nr:hypothetical protein BCV70DRAFT_202857 [Testicularia cyperi]